MSEPAFPCVYESFTGEGGGTTHFSQVGLTKRELFAAMAMQGFLSDAKHLEVISGRFEGPVYQPVAEQAVSFADALIAALEAKP